MEGVSRSRDDAVFAGRMIFLGHRPFVFRAVPLRGRRAGRMLRNVIAIIFNPSARGDKATAFRARLTIAVRAAQATGRKVVLRPTRCAGDAIHQTREAVSLGYTTVVAAGGDGTVNEVVNGLAQDAGVLERVRLGVLPLGTINVFAKEMGVPAGFDAAWQLLLGAAERQIDLGVADFMDDASAGPTRRWFVQMGGAGLDSLALGRVSWALKKKIGPLAYVWAGLQTLMSTLPMVEAEVDGRRVQGQLVAVGNGRFYGGRWAVFPSAQMDDGRLDLAVVERVTPWKFSRQFASLVRGQFQHARGLVHWQGREITLRPVSPAGAAIPFHLEGDNMGSLPVRFLVDPRRLRVVAPAK